MVRKMRLTDANVAKLKAQGAEYVVWDTRVPGFGVRVRPSGYKAYVLHDNRAGRSKRHTLGPAMLTDVAAARRRCLGIQAGEGEDHRDSAQPAPLFREFVAEQWKTARYDRFSSTTRRRVDTALRSQLLPAFGGKRLDRITRADVIRWFEHYSRTAPGGANRALEALQGIMNHALACDHVGTNPARGIKKNPRPRMTRFLSMDEIRRLHEVLDRSVAERPSRGQAADIIRLLLLTGCRRGEIVKLRWREVNGDVLDLADAKTGPRRVFLNPQAQNIIKRQPRSESAYVFPSPRYPSRHLWKDMKLWYRIRREAGIGDVRLHDLRHTHASQAVLQGVPLPVVSRLLGHRQLSMTMRYAHVADQEVEAAAERIGHVIAKACGISVS